MDGSADDLATGGGGEESGAGLPARSGGGVDRLQQPEIEGDIDASRRSPVAHQRDDGGHGARAVPGEGGIGHDGVEIARRGNGIAVRLQHAHMTGQRLDGTAHGFVDGAAGRDASGHVGEADAVDGVGILVDESYVSHFSVANSVARYERVDLGMKRFYTRRSITAPISIYRYTKILYQIDTTKKYQ